MDPKIRPAEAHEAEALAALHLETWRAAYRDQLPQDFLDGLQLADFVARARQRFAAGQDRAERIHLVVEEQGSAIGFVYAGPTRDPPGASEDPAGIGEVYAIYLGPGHWGRGLGRALMARALAELETRGFRTVTLWVIAGNHRACRFYEAAGFFDDGGRRTLDQKAPGPHRSAGPVTMPLVRYRLDLVRRR